MSFMTCVQCASVKVRMVVSDEMTSSSRAHLNISRCHRISNLHRRRRHHPAEKASERVIEHL